MALMGQKDSEKWTAAVDLQPTIPKSGRLLVIASPLPDNAGYDQDPDSPHVPGA